MSVRRSFEDLVINCEKEELVPGVATVESSTEAMAFGNIIFGGVIGAGVDMATGAAYDYPPMISVVMGEKITIQAPPPENVQETQPQAAAETVSTAAVNAPAVEAKPRGEDRARVLVSSFSLRTFHAMSE